MLQNHPQRSITSSASHPIVKPLQKTQRASTSTLPPTAVVPQQATSSLKARETLKHAQKFADKVIGFGSKIIE